MEYLKYFKTEEEYKEYIKSSPLLNPNTMYVDEQNDIIYNIGVKYFTLYENKKFAFIPGMTWSDLNQAIYKENEIGRFDVSGYNIYYYDNDNNMRYGGYLKNVTESDIILEQNYEVIVGPV